uniref:Uncharacterized protein n=1 Tax=Anguilla anguilla TaxID=7936 RepID=A0A0E9Q9S8_ANGAN
MHIQNMIPHSHTFGTYHTSHAIQSRISHSHTFGT